MIYRHAHKKSFENNLSNGRIALLVVGVFLAFILLYAPVRGVFTQTVYKFAPSVWEVGNSWINVFQTVSLNFQDKKFLQNENEMLKDEISRMEAQVLDRNLLSEQVNRLEEALGRAHGDDRVVAYVLAGPGLSLYDTLIVDAGEENGVIIGNKVVYAGSGVIGEVLEVSFASAKIKLYSSPGEETVVLSGPKHIPATAYGKGMGNFEAKIPKGSALEVGDYVVTLQDRLPIGSVSLVEENSDMPYDLIFFRASFNIAEIRSVEIIIDKHQ